MNLEMMEQAAIEQDNTEEQDAANLGLQDQDGVQEQDQAQNWLEGYMSV